MSTDLDERYPEHAKLNKVKDQSQSIYNFLHWAEDKGYLFGREIPTEPETVSEGANNMERYAVSMANLAQDSTFFRQAGDSALYQLLAEHFGIDPVKLEAEKRQMLDDIRAMNVPKAEV
jgi:hypothetical protein